MPIQEKPDLSGKTILLVEDNAFIAMEFESALEDAGSTVLCHSDAISAHGALLSGTVDFLLTDYFLGGDLSRTVIKEAIDKSIPYALLTGYAIDPADPLLVGATVFAKPCNAGQIVSHIAEVLQRGIVMDGDNDLTQNARQ